MEFIMTGDIHAPNANQQNSYFGLLLLCGFLVFDGFTSTFQENIFKQYSTTKYNQILWINLGSATISFLSLVGTGSLNQAIEFCMKHPRFAIDAGMISGAAVGGQYFIYSMVEEF